MSISGRQRVGGNPQLEINPVAELMMEVRHETTVTLDALYHLYAVNGGAAYDFGELEAGIAHGWFATTLFFTPAYDGRVNGRRHSAQYWSTDFTTPPWRGLSVVAHPGAADPAHHDLAESSHQPGCNLTNNCFSEPLAQRAVRERDSRIRRSSGTDLDLVGHRERGT
jgi:hypothetical protein